MSYFVVTHPFRDPIKSAAPAWNGHRSGPFSDRGEAERACTAALGSGMFFQVEIIASSTEPREAT